MSLPEPPAPHPLGPPLPPPEGASAAPDRRGAFRLLFFALVAVGAGNTMVTSAVLPPLARTLALPDWTVGAIFSLSALAWTVSSPFWGRMSSRWGRRRVAVIGLAGYGVSMLAFGLAGWAALAGWLTGWVAIFVAFLSARTLFGVFGSGTSPAAQAYVADRTHAQERTTELAALSSGFSFGAVAGPALAAALVAWFGLLSPFFFAAASAALIAWLIATRLPESRPPRRDTDPRADKGAWRDPALLPFLIYSTGLSVVSGVVLQTFPFALMDGMGVAGREASQFIAVAAGMGAMATLIAQLVLIPKLQPTNRTLMVWGGLAIAAGCALVPFSSDLAPLVMAQLAIGLGSGMARAGLSSGASLSCSAERQGAVAGLVVATSGMGYIVSPLLGPWVYEHVSRDAPFWISVSLLLAMTAYARWRTPEPPVRAP